MNIRIISLLAATTLLTAPAVAADNYNVKEAAGATIAKAAKDVTSVWFDKQICVTLADTTIDCFTELNASLRAEDTASGDADSGLPIFAVRKATPANTSNTDGDYEALQISAGRLWTDAGALLPTSLGAKVGTASLSVVPASDGFGVNATQAGTWNVTNVSGTVSLPTGAATAAKQPALGTAGTASSDVITVQGVASMTPIQTRSAGVATPVRIVSAGASTNLTEIADSGGCRIVSIAGAVARTSAVYLKLYNAADGSVTVGTTTPYITLPLPAGGTNPTSFQFDVNQVFASGACSLAMTTAVADNSTAALTAADVVGLTVIWGTN